VLLRAHLARNCDRGWRVLDAPACSMRVQKVLRDKVGPWRFAALIAQCRSFDLYSGKAQEL
jgi:hypothetical protein